MNKEIEKEILSIVNYPDYNKGKRYFKGYIDYRGNVYEDKKTIHIFSVESEREMKYYDVAIEINNTTKRINRVNCSCPQYDSYLSCKHIAACLIEYYEEIIPKETTKEDKYNISSRIFNALKQKETKKIKKEEVNLEIYLERKDTRYGYYGEYGELCLLDLELKIGKDRLYQAKAYKLYNFLNSYSNNEKLNFGKSFTYDPEQRYFNEENKKILDYLVFLNKQKDISYGNTNLLIGNERIKRFFELIKNETLYIVNYML